MESRVKVKILHQMQMHEMYWIEREPVRWFRFEEAIVRVCLTDPV